MSLLNDLLSKGKETNECTVRNVSNVNNESNEINVSNIISNLSKESKESKESISHRKINEDDNSWEYFMYVLSIN